jgi:DNA-binding helix-hairpin-helix protein with protein kinase domain
MSRQTNPSKLRDDSGTEVRLAAKPFAIGGEGSVYDVLSRPDVVAKIYNKPQSKERCEKLRAMSKLCTTDLLKIAAWPTATLYSNNSSLINGILMPRIHDFMEIHHLYSVAQRKKDFPDADWGFLLHTARNCSIAFESIHNHGHVVGDVNQKNVMVSKKGIVALVDCDSFQIVDGTKIFRCGVGVPEYTPPELHGKRFESLDRSSNHDLFGLAILLFHLLMLGRHPFSGVPLIQADIPIEKAIVDGYYAYTTNKSSSRLKPPPNVPPVTILDPSLIDMFERAFCTQKRPSATEWRSTLDKSLSQIVRCANDQRHSFLKAAGGCPWCGMITSSRMMFFLPKQGSNNNFRPEDLQDLLKRLIGLKLTFESYTRPKSTILINGIVPSGVKAIVPKPKFLPHPSPPDPIPMPKLYPLPIRPQLMKPSLKSFPASPTIPDPPELITHPIRPVDPPTPSYKTIPKPPIHPKLPKTPSPDTFFSRLCIDGMISGVIIIMIALPVGIICEIAFGLWWLLLHLTSEARQKRVVEAIKNAHQQECDRIDWEYNNLCEPIIQANKNIREKWNSAKKALDDQYRRTCKLIDVENSRRLSPWEAQKSAIEEDYKLKCQIIEQENRNLKESTEAANADLLADFERKSKSIETANRNLIAKWQEATAARAEAHAQACREIDEKNRRMISAWEALNSSWLDEEKRLKRQLDSINAEISILEQTLYENRKKSIEQFEQKKKDSENVVSNHRNLNQLYDRDISESEQDSIRLQKEQHLDSFLIRNAKIKGITSDRILSLESFGVQTANDIELLNHHKVPGIGPVLSERLFDWRKTISSKFVLKKSLPEAERNRIASRYAPAFLPLIQSVQTALRDLEIFGESQRRHDMEQINAIKAAVQKSAIISANLDALNRLV